MLKMGHAIAGNDADIKTIQNLTSLFYSQMGKESWAVPNETLCVFIVDIWVPQHFLDWYCLDHHILDQLYSLGYPALPRMIQMRF